jgi:hypothetical protein
MGGKDMEIAMRRAIGDIFVVAPKDGWIVVPTNVGWREDGRNVMGAGLAKFASARYRMLPLDYGRWCQMHESDIYIDNDNKIICAPSKALVKSQPWASWRGKADRATIRNSFSQLKAWVEAHADAVVKLPLFGAGCGGLPVQECVQMTEEAGFPDSVILVTLG